MNPEIRLQSSTNTGLVSSSSGSSGGVRLQAPSVGEVTIIEDLDVLKAEIVPQGRTIGFEVDGITGRLKIEVIDKASGEVIRQIPPEELISFAERFQKFLGIFVDKEV